MNCRVTNDQGRVVAALEVASVDEALDIAYAWNSDENRAPMVVAEVTVDHLGYRISYQLNLLPPSTVASDAE